VGSCTGVTRELHSYAMEVVRWVLSATRLEPASVRAEMCMHASCMRHSLAAATVLRWLWRASVRVCVCVWSHCR